MIELMRPPRLGVAGLGCDSVMCRFNVTGFRWSS